MPRLIREEEFIDKIAAISDLRTLSLPTIGKVLKECSTVDAVAVIRCEHCEKNEVIRKCCIYSWCNEYKTHVMDDDFCSRGILKKEKEHEHV